MADRDDYAKKLWNVLKAQLEDRSVLELGSVDDDTMAELEAEQIETIKHSLVEYAALVSPYGHR